jgi:Effector-associated domain 1
MDLNHLSEPQQKILRQTFIEAFDFPDLCVFLDEYLSLGLGHNLGYYGGDKKIRNTIFQLVKYAQQEGWTNRLIEALQQARPHDPNIQALVSRLALIDVEGNKHLVNKSLERTVKKRAGIQDFVAWTTRLEQLRKVVCRIEDPRDPRKALGTGFLVSNDLVLTNYHVVEMYIDVIDPGLNRVRDTAGLQCRFDYAIETGGENPGVVSAYTPTAGGWWTTRNTAELIPAIRVDFRR